MYSKYIFWTKDCKLRKYRLIITNITFIITILILHLR